MEKKNKVIEVGCSKCGGKFFIEDKSYSRSFSFGSAVCSCFVNMSSMGNETLSCPYCREQCSLQLGKVVEI